MSSLVVSFVWYLGASRGWWTPGWVSYLVAGLSALLLSGTGRPRAQRNTTPPSVEAVQEELARLRDDPQGRLLRHLRYHVAAAWPSERADEAAWTGVKFLVGDFMVARYAVSPIIKDENLTAEMLQTFAADHYQGEGARVVRNELAQFCGHPCVVTEAETAHYKEQRISFTLHASEYMARFTCNSAKHFQHSQPVMDALKAACEIVLPDLQTQVVFDGRVSMGIPADWTSAGNQPRLASWRAHTGPLDVKLHLLVDRPAGELTAEVFKHVPGVTPRPNTRVDPYWMMADGKLRVLRMCSFVSPKFARWALDAIRLPSGNVVVLETEHQGRDTDEWHNLLLDPMRQALLASIKDADVPVI
jgi:hypothetical protein